MALYFKEHTRQPRTDAQIKSGYEKFLQITAGDKPIGEIVKQIVADTKKFWGSCLEP